MAKRTDETMDSIQTMIRSGDLMKARAPILALARNKLERAQIVRLAYLARQAHMGDVSIRLLHRIVRSRKGQGAALATDEEKAEYGTALILIGAHREAIQILSEVDTYRLPRAFSPLALAHFRRWDWAYALPMLEEFLKRDLELTERFSTTHRYATALIHGAGDYAKARAILEKLAQDALHHVYPFVYQEALQMLIQACWFLGDHKTGLELIERLEKLPLSEQTEVFPLLLKEWRALHSFRSASSESKRGEALKLLREARAGFHRLKRFEFARGCDYYDMMLTRNEKLFLQLYFGTPYAAARKKFLDAMGRDASSMPEYHDFEIGRGGSARLDTLTGENTTASGRLKPGQIPQKTLQALLHDYYVPPGVAELHERLYAGQYFNPTTSPLQIRQALFRLRKWLGTQKFPLEVREENEVYVLHSENGCLLRYRRDIGDAKMTDLMARIRGRHGEAEFTSAEIADLLGISRNSAITELKKATEQGLVLKNGQGPATRYRAAPPTS